MVFFRAKCKLRALLRYAFKMFSKNGKIHPSKKYGINYEEIFKYLGPEPNDNNEYQIDHILPLSAFNFDNPVHIRAAFAPENHRWLSKEENLSKNDSYNKEEFEKYLTKFMEL
jgi:hypothetical protein